jgi:hypothetical protein
MNFSPVKYIMGDDKYVLRGFQLLLRSEGLESTAIEYAEEFIRYEARMRMIY